MQNSSLHQMFPKQKRCTSVEVGKREQWEFPTWHVPGELRVLDWYQQGLQLGRSNISSGSCRLLQLQQCFNAPPPALPQQPDYSDISLFWMEHLRKDRCFIMDRKMLPRCEVAKHPPCPAALPSASVESEECFSKGPVGSVKYKDRGCSRTNGLLFQCRYCGRLEAALCKMIKAFSRSSSWSCQGKHHRSFRTNSFFILGLSALICCGVQVEVSQTQCDDKPHHSFCTNVPLDNDQIKKGVAMASEQALLVVLSLQQLVWRLIPLCSPFPVLTLPKDS